MIVLTVDPGVRALACAVGWGECLRAVWFEPPPWHGLSRLALGRRALVVPKLDVIVVERPEYQGARSDAARTQDLLGLSWAGAGGAYYAAGAHGCDVCEYTPGQWKGSEAKPPQHLRLWEDCLTEAERKLFPPDTGKRITTAAQKCALHPGRPGADYYGKGKGSEVHNLLDAVAMYCGFVGRFR